MAKIERIDINRSGGMVEAANACDALNFHPHNDPLGDGHHTEVEYSLEDWKIGDALAYFMGTLYGDVDEKYFYYKRTSVDEWARVARALRIHGLKIVDTEDREYKLYDSYKE